MSGKLSKKLKNSLGNIPHPVSPELSTGPVKTIKSSELEKITENVVRKDLKKTPKQGQDQDKQQGNDKDQEKEAEEEED